MPPLSKTPAPASLMCMRKRPLPRTAPALTRIVKHFASAKFWAAYEALPLPVRQLADANYTLLKRDPRHLCNSRRSDDIGPSGSVCAIALAVDIDGGYLWFWIGSHADYDRLIG